MPGFFLSRPIDLRQLQFRIASWRLPTLVSVCQTRPSRGLSGHPNGSGPSTRSALARISTHPPTAARDRSESAALRSDRVLEVVSDTPRRPTCCAPCSHGHLPGLATVPGIEKSGPARGCGAPLDRQPGPRHTLPAVTAGTIAEIPFLAATSLSCCRLAAATLPPDGRTGRAPRRPAVAWAPIPRGPMRCAFLYWQTDGLEARGS